MLAPNIHSRSIPKTAIPEQSEMNLYILRQLMSFYQEQHIEIKRGKFSMPEEIRTGSI